MNATFWLGQGFDEADLIGNVQEAKLGIRERDRRVFQRDAVVTADADRIRTDVRQQAAVGCRRATVHTGKEIRKESIRNPASGL